MFTAITEASMNIFILSLVGGVRVTKITASGFDYWIYRHRVQILFIALNYNAVAILYTLSSPLHTQ
jgi:hypothetical protein